MENILLRIKQFADFKQISIRQLEQMIGASNGVINNAIKKGTDIQSKWISIIIEKCIDLNPTWLLTGKGEMLIKEGAGDGKYNGNQIGNGNNNQVSIKINEMAHEQDRLHQQIDKQQMQIDALTQQLKLKDEIIELLRGKK